MVCYFLQFDLYRIALVPFARGDTLVHRAKTKAEAMEGLERWKTRHADVWPLLEPADVLIDSMRGRSSTWTRIRLNLEHVPEQSRPPQEPLEVDYNPWAGFQP